MSSSISTPIPGLRTALGARIVDAEELDRAPRALVDIGLAPDGLPWLCDVDRSSRLDHLYATVCGLFEVEAVADLPPTVREATEGALARGLMGIHPVPLDERGPVPAFVTRRTARALLGPTLLEQLLAPTRAAAADSAGGSSASLHRAAITSISPHGMAEKLEQAIDAARAGRHLVLALSGETWTATVSEANRALRVPGPPFRRVVFESLAALPGATARITSGYETTRVPLGERRTYVDALVRAGEAPAGGTVSYEVPRATVLKLLVAVADLLATGWHRRGLVHGDVTPGNLLLDGGTPTSPDALDVEVGNYATAATFEWAAPEQIVGRPLDPRADVYALGKLACALVGAVPFGEKIEYVVPSGGHTSRTVELLKTDGVFIDAKTLEVGRDWQAAWQDALVRLVAYDRERRLDSAVAAAALLGELAEKFPPPGTLPLAGMFGRIAAVQRPATWPLARVISDA